jgi:hypothetical protein
MQQSKQQALAKRLRASWHGIQAFAPTDSAAELAFYGQFMLSQLPDAFSHEVMVLRNTEGMTCVSNARSLIWRRISGCHIGAIGNYHAQWYDTWSVYQKRSS